MGVKFRQRKPKVAAHLTEACVTTATPHSPHTALSLPFTLLRNQIRPARTMLRSALRAQRSLLRPPTAASLLRPLSAAPPPPLRVAVVGSGPSGFYTAKYLLKDHPGCHVDVLDALPTPYGALCVCVFCCAQRE